MTDNDAEKALDYIKNNAHQYAKAKAERTYLEQFLKSKKAILMASSQATTSAGQERDAYAHQDYIDLLEALKTAVETEETLKWKLTAAEIQIDIYRTQESSKRAMVKF